MLVVRPWFAMPADVKAMEPAEVLDADVLRQGDRLDGDQKEVLMVGVIMSTCEGCHGHDIA